MAALLAATLAAPAPAQDEPADQPASPETLEKLEERAQQDRERARDLAEKADALSQEMRALKQRSVELARENQNLETRLSKTEARLKRLRRERAALRERLDGRRDQLLGTLQALERIALHPPVALAVTPESPITVARAASLLNTAVPEIETRAAALREELDQLETVRKRIEQERTRLATTRGELAEKRDELAALMERKKRLVERTRKASREARRAAERLGREAADMRELMQALESRRKARAAVRVTDVPVPGRKPAPPDRVAADADTGEPTATADNAAAPQETPSGDGIAAGTDSGTSATRTASLSQPADIRAFPEQENSLRMPAQGTVVAGYGDAVERSGTTTGDKGMMIATRPEAQVVAPFDGKIVYAGPFKAYGRILIIQHGDRYHSLLAGLGRVDAIVGQWVFAGEPVGTMGDPSGQSPELYVELRRAGQPIDPGPWLARRGNEVRG